MALVLSRGRSMVDPHRAREVEWRLRYTPEALTREDQLVAASAIADLYELLVVYTSTKDACALVADARRALQGKAANAGPKKKVKG